VLFRRRRRRHELQPIGEADAYAHSYGERSDDVTNVKAVEPEPVEEEAPRLTDRAIRNAFLSRLNKR